MNVNDVETCCVYGRFCIQRSGYDKRRDQSDRRRIRKDRDTGRVKQQCASLDTGRADGSAGDQFRTFDVIKDQEKNALEQHADLSQ